MPTDRYAQCDETCTVDCGACKGQGRPPIPLVPRPHQRPTALADWQVKTDEDGVHHFAPANARETVNAGEHWQPLDDVHKTLGDEGVLIHLAMDHKHIHDRRLGPDMAKRAHQILHGETP